MPPEPAAFHLYWLLAFLGVLALLIGNTAAGLAGGLAGSLALAAATLVLAQVASLDGLDMFHGFTLRLVLFTQNILPQEPYGVNRFLTLGWIISRRTAGSATNWCLNGFAELTIDN